MDEDANWNVSYSNIIVQQAGWVHGPEGTQSFDPRRLEEEAKKLREQRHRNCGKRKSTVHSSNDARDKSQQALGFLEYAGEVQPATKGSFGETLGSSWNQFTNLNLQEVIGERLGGHLQWSMSPWKANEAASMQSQAYHGQHDVSMYHDPASYTNMNSPRSPATNNINSDPHADTAMTPSWLQIPMAHLQAVSFSDTGGAPLPIPRGPDDSPEAPQDVGPHTPLHTPH
jgi:hypothetical protein